jgi:hypothetical protein
MTHPPLPVLAVTQYAGERDILDLRLRTLEVAVTHHLITEATLTYTGALPEWEQLHLPPGTRATVTQHTPHGGHRSPWGREKDIRDAALAAAADLAAQEMWHPARVWLLIADLDEIPSPYLVRAVAAGGEAHRVYRLPVRYHQLAIDLAVPWYGPKELWEYAQPLMVTLATALEVGSLHEIRRNYQTRAVTGTGLGWHLSCMGGPDAVTVKLKAYSHTEYADLTREHVLRCVDGREDLVGRTGLVDVTEGRDLPWPVLADPDRWYPMTRAGILAAG